MSWLITGTYKGAAVSDADAQTYLRAVETADNQGPLEQGVQQAVNQFVIGCKADTNWSKITSAGVLAGARTLNGSLVPLKGNAPINTGNGFVQADYNRSLGLKGSLSTAKDLSILTLDNTLNNTSYGFYLIEASSDFAAERSFMAAGNNARINPNNIMRVQDTSNTVVSGFNEAPGLKAGLRDPSRIGTKIAYTNKQENTASVASAATFDSNVRLFSRIPNNAAFQVDARISFYWAGEYLNASLLESRVATLMSALAAAALT
jgi:hypothetical protein